MTVEHGAIAEAGAEAIPEMVAQARQINTWGANVYVKLPVTTTRGEPLFPAVRALSHDGVKVNLTAVFTAEQAVNGVEALAGSTRRERDRRGPGILQKQFHEAGEAQRQKTRLQWP